MFKKIIVFVTFILLSFTLMYGVHRVFQLRYASAIEITISTKESSDTPYYLLLVSLYAIPVLSILLAFGVTKTLNKVSDPKRRNSLTINILLILLLPLVIYFFSRCNVSPGLESGYVRSCSCVGKEVVIIDKGATDGPTETLCIGIPTKINTSKESGVSGDF